MNKLTRLAAGAGAAALLALGAAPAQAQYYPYPQGQDVIDPADVARGVAVAGAAAAAVGAIANAARGAIGGGYGYPQGGYGYPQGGYGYPQVGYAGQGQDRFAVDACAARASRYGRVSIGQVYRKDSRRFRVEGMADANYYGTYGGDRRAFQCEVRDDGRVTYFDTDKIRY